MKTTPVILLFLLACPALALEVPAKDFPEKSCGTAQGDFWNLWSTGAASAWVRFPAAGTYRIEVEARGEPARGVWPILRVRLDLEPVGEVVVAKRKAGTFPFETHIEAGTRRLSLQFTNDYFDPGREEDRNLHLGRVRIVPAEAGIAHPSLASAPDWRKEADAGIEKHRKGRLVLEVEDASGAPAPEVQVRASLVRHAFPFGCALSSGLAHEGWSERDRRMYTRLFPDLFNHAVHENALKWHVVNRRGPVSDFGDADRILSWCEARSIPMRGHCLFWASRRCIPRFASALDDEDLRGAIFRRIEEVLERYGGRITDFDMNNEMIHNDWFAKRLGEGIRVEMFRKAHEVAPDTPMYVNDFAILSGAHLDRYVEHIRGLMEAGAPVGGIGCQGHFGAPGPDPRVVRMALDRLASFGLPIKITEFDIDSADEEEQAKRLEAFYRVCFGHPAVQGILMWGYWAGAHWRPRGALFRRDWSPKPAAEAYLHLVHQTWRTLLEGSTDEGGRFEGQAFFGTYRVTLRAPGRDAAVQEIVFSREDAGERLRIALR